jgi:hypothetical protein
MVEHHDALTIKVSNGLVQLAIFILHYFILKGLLVLNQQYWNQQFTAE